MHVKQQYRNYYICRPIILNTKIYEIALVW